MAENKTVRSITGRQTTAGATIETVNLVVDGAAPAASISVGVGQTLTISDVIMSGALTPTYWQLQQTTDGLTWSVIAYFGTQSYVNTLPTESYSYNVGLVVNGGATTAFRVQVTTPGGASDVHITLRSYVAQ